MKFRAKPGDESFNIIICKNLINANEHGRRLVKKEIPELSEYVDKNVGFVEASIGRMVSVVTEEKKQGNPLKVYVESYNILSVDKKGFKMK